MSQPVEDLKAQCESLSATIVVLSTQIKNLTPDADRYRAMRRSACLGLEKKMRGQGMPDEAIAGVITEFIIGFDQKVDENIKKMEVENGGS